MRRGTRGDRTPDEIAEAVGTSPAAVRQIAHRARDHRRPIVATGMSADRRGHHLVVTDGPDADTGPGSRRGESSGALVALSQRADAFLSWGEIVVYFAVAVILAAGAALLVGDAVTTFVDLVVEGQPVLAAATELLSVLLLVFVFVELLGAVRKTLRERRLLAEPFLLVGIIASIKEIVVVAGAERPKESGFAEFRDGMIEIGVLSGVVLVLAVSALLLRMRQEKPAEEDDSVGSAG
jgi:uncharacterized membrane protein (DUF373 family)